METSWVAAEVWVGGAYAHCARARHAMAKLGSNGSA